MPSRHAQAPSQANELAEFLDALAQEAMHLVNAEGGCAGIRTAEGMVCRRYFQGDRAMELAYCWPPGHGLPGWLLIHKTPYLTNDAASDPQIVQQLCRQFGVRTALSTPIVDAAGEPIGFFEIHNRRDGLDFTTEDRDKLIGVARIASLAIRNIGYLEAARQTEERLRAVERELTGKVRAMTRMHQLGMCLSGPVDDLDAALSEILQTAVELHDGSMGLLSRFDEASSKLRAVASIGFSKDALALISEVLPGYDQGGCGSAFATRRRVVIVDTEVDPRFACYREAARLAGFRAVHSTPIHTRSGAILGVLSVHFDRSRMPTESEMLLSDLCALHAAEAIQTVTAQSALRNSERQYRELVEALPVAVFATDAEGRITVYNEAAAALWGRRPQIGQDLWTGWAALRRPDGSPVSLAECPMAIALREGRSFSALELNGERPDGTVRSFLAHPLVVRNDKQEITGVINVLVDITERKEAERVRERLRESQKLESVGLLAGGVAHDFNNILVGVLGNASLASQLIDAGSPASPLLHEIETAAERAAHLTRQMLAYAGKGQFLIEDVDISAAARESIALVRPAISPRVLLHIDATNDLPAVRADRSQTQQVVMNLVLNAAEAVGDRPGAIYVRTLARKIAKGEVTNCLDGCDAPAGAYACIEVTDNGCGMDEATRRRIFDPFFTTKFTGRGLGLAAVAGVVRGHNGAITVSSAPGRGTTFAILFPTTGEYVAGTVEPLRAVAVHMKAARILVVDDEPIVLRTARIALERDGHTVHTAESGPAALELVSRDPDSIDLVLLDLSMPGMSGYETLAELRRIKPEVRALISSGYPETEAVRQFPNERAVGFIQKPYTVRRLAESVQNALGSGAASAGA